MVTLGTASSGSDKSAPMALVWRGEAAMNGVSRSEKRARAGSRKPVDGLVSRRWWCQLGVEASSLGEMQPGDVCDCVGGVGRWRRRMRR